MTKRGKPFKSGNEFGQRRPVGIRNKKTLMNLELEEQALALLNEAMSMAMKEDSAMMRALLPYIIQPLKDDGQTK